MFKVFSKKMPCAVKERDTFPTIYARDFIWHELKDKSERFSSPDAFALTKDEKREFIDPNARKEIPWEEQLEIIKNLYAQRMKTTYYVSFCEKQAKKSNSYEAGDDEDTLLSTADKLYSPKSQKTLIPIPTSRRVMGYSRPAYYYTGLTEYQEEFGKFGYKQLFLMRDQRLKQRINFCDKFATKH